MRLLMHLATSCSQLAFVIKQHHVRCIRSAALLTLQLAIAGCNGISPAEVVTHTRECGSEELASDLLLRLSRYTGEADTFWVLQACHPTDTACEPLLIYSDGPPPLLSLDHRIIDIGLLGGSQADRLIERYMATSGDYVVRITRVDAQDERAVADFLRAVGVPFDAKSQCAAYRARHPNPAR